MDGYRPPQGRTSTKPQNTRYPLLAHYAAYTRSTISREYFGHNATTCPILHAVSAHCRARPHQLACDGPLVRNGVAVHGGQTQSWSRPCQPDQERLSVRIQAAMSGRPHGPKPHCLLTSSSTLEHAMWP